MEYLKLIVLICFVIPVVISAIVLIVLTAAYIKAMIRRRKINNI